MAKMFRLPFTRARLLWLPAREGLLWFSSELRLRVIRYRAAGKFVDDLGIVSGRCVTNAGVAFMVDDFDNGVTDISLFNFHAHGEGALGEFVTDTALGAEVDSRVAGTRTQPTANQYRTVATITATAPRAITEHGLFSQLAVGGTLWDRSLFGVINLALGDSIEHTYTLTVNAGG